MKEDIFKNILQCGGKWCFKNKGLIIDIFKAKKLKIYHNIHYKVVHTIRDIINHYSKKENTFSDNINIINEKLGDLVEIYANECKCNFDRLTCALHVITKNEAICFSVTNSGFEGPYKKGQSVPLNDTNFACLVGNNDGKTNWNPTRTVFCCNDIHGDKYRNKFPTNMLSRFNNINSIITYPIRIANEKKGKHDFLGFLTFAGIKKKSFSIFPNTFDFDDSKEYHELILKNHLFHLGCSIADLLLAVLVLYNSENKSN